jgi:N-methylhydantoinase A
MTSDSIHTKIMEPGAFDAGTANAIFAEMEDRGLQQMRLEGLSEDEISIERHIDARFAGQGHELSVPVHSNTLTADDLERASADFREIYAKVYGLRQEYPVQLVNFRTRIVGKVPKLELGRANPGDVKSDRALKKRRPVYFREPGHFIDTPVYERELLGPGDVLQGPAVVEEPDSTTIVPPGHLVRLGEYRELSIDRVAQSVR